MKQMSQVSGEDFSQQQIQSSLVQSKLQQKTMSTEKPELRRAGTIPLSMLLQKTSDSRGSRRQSGISKTRSITQKQQLTF